MQLLPTKVDGTTVNLQFFRGSLSFYVFHYSAQGIERGLSRSRSTTRTLIYQFAGPAQGGFHIQGIRNEFDSEGVKNLLPLLCGGSLHCLITHFAPVLVGSYGCSEHTGSHCSQSAAAH